MKKHSFILSTDKQYYIVAIVFVLLISIFYNLQFYIGYETVSLIFLFCIILFPLFGFSKGPIITASIIGALGWNYYFIPPHFTFHIDKQQDIMMFFLFFVVAVVIGMLTSRLKTQETMIVKREEKTNALNTLLKDLFHARSIDEVTAAAVKNIKNVFNYDSAFIYVTDDEKLSPEANPSSSAQISREDWIVAEWCFKSKSPAGKTTTILPDVDFWFLPLTGTRQQLGCVGLIVPDDEKISREVNVYLEEFISQITSAVEREILSERAKKNYG